MSVIPTLRRLIREICGTATTDLEDVLATAQMAHLGQTRRSGEPYITHPEAVADIVYAYYGDKSLCAAAILHDTLEDAPRIGTVKSPEDMASLIAGSFGDPAMGDEVLNIVRALSHDKSVPYDEYVMGLSKNVDALRIKLSDILHNLRTSPGPRQREKYGSAIQKLEGMHGGMPSGISSGHWKELKSAIGGDKQVAEWTLRRLIEAYSRQARR